MSPLNFPIPFEFPYRSSKRIIGFTPAALEALHRYRWPGNVRELKNVVERAAILCRGEQIDLDLLAPSISGRDRPSEVALGDRVPFEQIEEAHIRRVLAGSTSLEDAADALDIDVATLWRKRRKYGI